MAANLQSRGLAIFGKRFVGQIVSRESVAVVPAAVCTLRKGVHTSTYDKNLEEHVQATVVPDDVIPPDQSEKYWGPHPQTGVFGPASDHHKPPASAGVRNTVDSVLEEKAFFRPLEDLDKPEHP